MSIGHNKVNFSKANPSQEKTRERAHHQVGLGWVEPLAEANEMITPSHEALLVGRADQYRLGEMLMPHVMSRLLHFSKIRCAGLVSADLTAVGGHAVRNYGESLFDLQSPRLKLIHFGGDALALDLIEGYKSAADEVEAERFESLTEISSREEMLRYARRRTGQISDFAYVLEPEGEFWGAGLSFHAVGLSDPGRLDGLAKSRLLSILRRAQFVGIRDENGAVFLEREGIAVERMPCGLTVLPQVCARQLREHRDRDSLQAIRSRFPNGWITVETSEIPEGDFDRLTSALREVVEREDLGLVFFEANKPASASSSHTLRHWVESFPEWQAAEFPSENLWEVASLLLHSRLYCGSCLSSRIICMSGGVARINVPTGGSDALSYCELWEHDRVPIQFDDNENWSDALAEALAVDLTLLQRHASWLHVRYRESLDRFCHDTGMEARLVPGDSSTAHETASGRLHHLQGFRPREESSKRTFRKAAQVANYPKGFPWARQA